MRSPIENCDAQIARLRAEIERRRAVGHDDNDQQRRLKTLMAVRAVHAAEDTRSGDSALGKTGAVESPLAAALGASPWKRPGSRDSIRRERSQAGPAARRPYRP